jgi:hypothetical protein
MRKIGEAGKLGAAGRLNVLGANGKLVESGVDSEKDPQGLMGAWSPAHLSILLLQGPLRL